MKKRILKVFLIIAVIVGFSSVGVFGTHFMMDMDENGAMKDCPIMAGDTAMCDMDGAGHLSAFKRLFYAIFQKNAILILLASMAAIVSAFVLLKTDEQLNAFTTIPIRDYYFRGKKTIFHKRE